MRAQGWYPDPYGSHEHRWFSDGEPTNLVRDEGTESYHEPPQGQRPVNPVGRTAAPRDEQERPIGERGAWPWWAVCLPGVLALAVSFCLFLSAALLTAMNDCFDTCGSPAPPPGAPALAVQEPILFAAVFALLVGGLSVPARRRVIAFALWAALAFAVALVPLNAS